MCSHQCFYLSKNILEKGNIMLFVYFEFHIKNDNDNFVGHCIQYDSQTHETELFLLAIKIIFYIRITYQMRH